MWLGTNLVLNESSLETRNKKQEARSKKAGKWKVESGNAQWLIADRSRIRSDSSHHLINVIEEAGVIDQ